VVLVPGTAVGAVGAPKSFAPVEGVPYNMTLPAPSDKTMLLLVPKMLMVPLFPENAPTIVLFDSVVNAFPE
jgi:hypothetical protein